MRLFVMARTAIMSMVKRPATRKYPFGPRRKFYKNSRGRIDQNIEKCVFCGLCEKKCPTHAITVVRDEKTWKIDRMKCMTCGYCVEVCPVKCLSMENEYTGPSVSRKEDIYRHA